MYRWDFGQSRQVRVAVHPIKSYFLLCIRFLNSTNDGCAKAVFTVAHRDYSCFFTTREQLSGSNITGNFRHSPASLCMRLYRRVECEEIKMRSRAKCGRFNSSCLLWPNECRLPYGRTTRGFVWKRIHSAISEQLARQRCSFTSMKWGLYPSPEPRARTAGEHHNFS